MYRDQFGEFVSGYWDLKGSQGHSSEIETAVRIL